jgi:hypothetical protein
MPTNISATSMTEEQQKIYLCKLLIYLFIYLNEIVFASKITN